MTENVSVILHWNADYAEIPRKKLPVVVEKSYEPMIAALEEWRDGTVCFNLTGHTIEFLQQNFPELIERMKELVRENTIEMLACGYSHPILPLLPKERVKKQIKDHINLLKKTFGKHPQGFWPPELAVSPAILKQIKALGLDWVTIDYEHFQLAQWFGNEYNPFERRRETLTEFLVKAYWLKGLRRVKAYLSAKRMMQKANAEQSQPLERVFISGTETLKAYLSSVSWTYSTQFAVGGFVPIYTAKMHLKSILQLKTRILPLYASDIEFFGYRTMGPTPAKPQSLVNFLEKLKENNIYTSSPTQIKDDFWAEQPKNICTGSWAPNKSLEIWTESADNRELIRRLQEIYTFLQKFGWKKRIIAKIEPYLRIVENSDARGWAPLPERKQEAYSALNTIFDLLEKEQKR